MTRKNSFSYKFWHDKNGKFVVLQKPDPFLWTWIVALVLSIALGANTFTHYVGIIGGIAIIVWAILQIIRGVNYFYRTLGVLVLLLILVSRFL